MDNVDWILIVENGTSYHSDTVTLKHYVQRCLELFIVKERTEHLVGRRRQGIKSYRRRAA